MARPKREASCDDGSIAVLRKRTNVKPSTNEPNWSALIPDQLGQSNLVARRLAKTYWADIVKSLKDNRTYSPDCLETVKRLVLYRVRFDVMSIRYFQFGDVVFSSYLNKNVQNSACEAMDRSQKIISFLESEL